MRVMVAPLCSTSVSTDELLRCVDSIMEQEYTPFSFDVVVICNTNDAEYYDEVKAALSSYDVQLHRTDSNGGNGLGHNSVMRHFLEVYKKEDYTHLMMIDGDDFYYPCAFACIDDIASLVEFDYLSNMQFADSVRCHETQQMHREVVPGVWLHSDFNFRYPIAKHPYWDGHNCGGGEVTLCVSAKAVEYGLWHMEVPTIPDDVTHMLYALKGYVEGKLKYVNTDCNDVYVYDKTNPIGTTNQPDFKFNPDQWPEKERNLFRGPTFAPLRGLTREHIPWVTIPPYLTPEDKVDFVRGNLINKGQFTEKTWDRVLTMRGDAV